MNIYISTVDKLTSDIKLKNSFKYSNEFTFIPITNHDNDNIIIQTPKVLIPFGINNQNNTIDISYINIDNDNKLNLLYDKLNIIYNKLNKHYKNYKVNHFIKENIMRLKLNNLKIYNQNKIQIHDIPNNCYGELIIHLNGLWIVNNNIWFNWIALQIKINEPIYLRDYSFNDKKHIPPPPPLPPPPPISLKKDFKLNIKKPKRKSNPKSDIPIISLDEVKNILNNLNKINIFNIV